jgi:hypothetical protein
MRSVISCRPTDPHREGAIQPLETPVHVAALGKCRRNHRRMCIATEAHEMIECNLRFVRVPKLVLRNRREPETILFVGSRDARSDPAARPRAGLFPVR